MTDREKLLRRIKALLDKTVASGCPVDEALAALNKAKELIEEHGVTDAELQSIGATFYGRSSNSQSQSQSPRPPPPPPNPQRPARTAHGGAVLFCVLLAAWFIGGLLGPQDSAPVSRPSCIPNRRSQHSSRLLPRPQRQRPRFRLLQRPSSRPRRCAISSRRRRMNT